MKWLLVFVPIIAGCEAFTEFAQEAETVETAGEMAGEIGPVIAAYNPEIGILVVAGGGILLAVAKFLKEYMKGKNDGS